MRENFHIYYVIQFFCYRSEMREISHKWLNYVTPKEHTCPIPDSLFLFIIFFKILINYALLPYLRNFHFATARH